MVRSSSAAAPGLKGARPEFPPALLTTVVALEVVLVAFVAATAPSSLIALSVLLVLQAVVVVALVAPRIAVFGVMTIVGLSPDGWMGDIGVSVDLVVPQKLMMMALAGLLVARFGLRLDFANPTVAYSGLFLVTSARPYGFGLTFGESVRSFVGTVAPWTLGFARMPLYIATAFLTMVELLPLIQLIGGILLQGAGIRPMLDAGGRLGLLKGPPTLAHYCLWATVLGVAQLLRNGRRRHLLLLGLNLAILLATGARAPTAYAAVFCGICFLFVPSSRFGGWRRILLLLSGGVILAGGVTAMLTLGSIRALDASGGASGRDLVWPLFEDAIRESPLLGHGIGAGRFVLDPDDPLAQLIGTTAAHNEYLRFGVEIGLLGLVIFFAAMVVWCVVLSRPLIPRERFILRFAFVIFGLLSISDNTVISLTSLVFISFVTAFSARGAAEAELRRAGVNIAADGRLVPPREAAPRYISVHSRSRL